MLRYLLVFLAGLLVGANLVYFLVTRDGVDRAASVQAQPDARTAAPAVDIGRPPAPADATTPAAPSVDRTSGNATPIDAATSSATAGTARSQPPVSAPPSATQRPQALPSGLVVPVRGVRPGQLDNTFDDARGQGRVHEALDIMAPRGTPVLAVADGTVEKLFTSVPGGLTIYQFEPSGRYAYYYAHLDRYAPGLAEGDRLEQGQVIGYVGSTGNASEDAPHLHFAIFRLGPEKQWWKGTAINPYPLLAGTGAGADLAAPPGQ